MWLQSEKPLLLLAPMDGYTDGPFRCLIKKIAPECLVFTEFLSAREMAQGSKNLLDKLRFKAIEHPVIVQLYGKDPEDFVTSSKIAQDHGAAGIDINMGCPSKKVVAHSHGSALMKDIDLSSRIIEKVRQNISVPITVKTRLGWENHDQLIPFIQKLESAGLQGITIHGRTYRQKFSGSANWDPIYSLKREVAIPVFGNGDIVDGWTAKQRLKNLDGVMVGRAILTNPWVVAEVRNHLFFEEKDFPSPPPFHQVAALWMEFVEDGAAIMGERRACLRFRKFMIQIVQARRPDSGLRREATQIESIQSIQTLMNKLL